MRVLAFAASNSSQSINRRLANHAADVFEAEFAPGAEIDRLDINDFEMPIYSIDREQADGVPALANAFIARIAAADRVIVSFAEHNGHYCAAFKNLFDWASRLEKKVYQDKPMVLLSTSPGPGGAGSVLKAAVESAPFFGCDLRASLSVPRFGDSVDPETDVLIDDALSQALRAALGKLV